MSAQDPSLMGYVYLIAGVALGIMGFVVYLMVRERQSQEDKDSNAILEPSTREEETRIPIPTPEAKERMDLPPRAILLHQDTDGQLVLEVDDKIYRDAHALKASPDWPLAETLSSELRKWLGARRMPDAKPLPRRGRAPAKESYAPESPNMVEEINNILIRRSDGLPEEYRGVRLIEGIDGSIKVLVGVESYPLDEVPFEEVRALISEAVSDWDQRG